MKKMFLLFAVLFSSSAFSHMNLGSVNNQLEFKGEYNPPQSEQDQRWANYNPTPNNPAPPITSIPKKNFWRMDVSNGTRSTGKSVNDWICSVGRAGGTYHRGLKGINVNVYPSGNVWHVQAYHNSGGSDNWGTVICWER